VSRDLKVVRVRGADALGRPGVWSALDDRKLALGRLARVRTPVGHTAATARREVPGGEVSDDPDSDGDSHRF
jgi:hypothetical protein